MKNKKILFLLIAILLVIIFIIYLIINNFNSKEDPIIEYTPEEEISNTQLRQTIVKLYYINTQTEKIEFEPKYMNSSELINEPYSKVINLLIESPQSNILQSVFPEKTELISSSLSNNCITLNFNENIQNFKDETQKNNIINSLLFTLTQFNEINSFNILINNETSPVFNDTYTYK